MKISLVTVAAIAALSLSACGETGGTPAAPETGTEAELAATQSSPVLLGAEGLKVQATPGGEVLTIAMDAPRQEAIAAVSQALGAPPQEEVTLGDCGAGAMDVVSWGDRGLELMFQDGALTGWESDTDDLHTTRGIHVGSSIEELRAAYPEVEIQETTVGWAFILGDMYGLLDENQTRVELIRMGVNCDAH